MYMTTFKVDLDTLLHYRASSRHVLVSPHCQLVQLSGIHNILILRVGQLTPFPPSIQQMYS